jgi:hypothetical protein
MADPSLPSEEGAAGNPEPKQRGGGGGLDEDKRTKIIALVANGSSRRVAAKIVGCAASTITRTAARDPHFAEMLLRAENRFEIDALRSIQKAAKDERYWRAAAWLLERKNPLDFGARPAQTYSAEQVQQMFLRVLPVLGIDVSDHACGQAVDLLHTLLAAALPPPPAIGREE